MKNATAILLLLAAAGGVYLYSKSQSNAAAPSTAAINQPWFSGVFAMLQKTYGANVSIDSQPDETGYYSVYNSANVYVGSINSAGTFTPTSG